MSEIKKEGFFRLRDTGGSFYDLAQQNGVSGKIPGRLKLTKKVKHALVNNALVEITEKEYRSRLEELGLEDTKKGLESIVVAEKTTEDLIANLLANGVFTRQGRKFLLDGKDIAKSKSGLVKKIESGVKFKKDLEAYLDEVIKESKKPKQEAPTKEVVITKPTVDVSKMPEDVLFETAVEREVIINKDGKYSFNDLLLGESDEEVIAFLCADANRDIKDSVKLELSK